MAESLCKKEYSLCYIRTLGFCGFTRYFLGPLLVTPKIHCIEHWIVAKRLINPILQSFTVLRWSGYHKIEIIIFMTEITLSYSIDEISGISKLLYPKKLEILSFSPVCVKLLQIHKKKNSTKWSQLCAK